MPSGRCGSLNELPARARAVIDEARRAVLSTTDPDGKPHSVPVCFALVGGDIVTPIDEKPKSTKRLARLRNVAANPAATVLFDRWDEDWTRLGWVMVRGRARIETSAVEVEALRDRYPQYAGQAIKQTIIVAPESITWWTWH